MQELLNDCKVPADIVLPKLAADPFKITTVQQFANYFDEKKEVKTLFCDKVSIEDGNVIGDLKQAWRVADALVSRLLTRTSQGLPEEDMDDPLRQEIQQGLEATFKASAGFAMPQVWQGPDTMLGRLHREFVKRTHVLNQINKIRCLRMAVASGPASSKRNIGNDIQISVGKPDGPAGPDVNTTSGYLLGLKILTMTMAVAGSFKVTREVQGARKDVLFCPLDPMIKHLSEAELYVLTHSPGLGEVFSDHDVLVQLRRVDEAIRSECDAPIRT